MTSKRGQALEEFVQDIEFARVPHVSHEQHQLKIAPDQEFVRVSQCSENPRSLLFREFAQGVSPRRGVNSLRDPTVYVYVYV